MRVLRSIAAGVALVALASIASAAPHSPAQSKAAVTAALANKARADQAADDERRKAAEVLTFAGVGPGDVVVDFIPASGYWTRIFTAAVGAKGHVYAIWPVGSEKYAEAALPALKARNLANVTVEVQTTPLPTSPKPVDLFWTAQNYHDIGNGGRGEPALRAFDAAVFKMLKPGGIYLITDHADATGTAMTGTETKHRIEPSIVKGQVMAAGFQFVGESRVLRNAADDHSLAIFDPAIKGRTDQFVYKFRKPD